MIDIIKMAIESNKHFCLDECYHEFDGCTNERCEVYQTIKALEKQIPKKPDCEEAVLQGLDYYGRPCEVTAKTYNCPVCDAFLGYVEEDEGEHFRYCPDCGQALDWEDE